jgi:hypothetical protein
MTSYIGAFRICERVRYLVAMGWKNGHGPDKSKSTLLTLRVISRQRGNWALLGVKRTSCGSLDLQVLPFENVVAPGSIRTHGCAELVQM